jgi:hypothetical protein
MQPSLAPYPAWGEGKPMAQLALLLEPDEHPAAKSFKAALVEDGIPFISFGLDDMQQEHETETNVLPKVNVSRR